MAYDGTHENRAVVARVEVADAFEMRGRVIVGLVLGIVLVGGLAVMAVGWVLGWMWRAR